MSCISKPVFASAIISSALAVLAWKWLKNLNQVVSKGKVFPGLINIGNTCFMNAVLQCFASQEVFIKWLGKMCRECKIENKTFLVEVLSNVMYKLTGGCSEKHFDPTYLLQDLMARGWHIPYEEHDAHEFCNAVFCTLSDELKFYRQYCVDVGLFLAKSIDKPISKGNGHLVLRCIPEQNFSVQKLAPNLNYSSAKCLPFHGLLLIKLRCSSCGYNNPMTYEAFNNLSIPIKLQAMWHLQITLYDCLQEFFASEIVHNVHCKNCSSGDKRSKTSDTCDSVLTKKPQSDVNLAQAEECKLFFPKLVTNVNVNKATSSCSVKYTKTNFQKQTMIAKLPNCFCIHLQRLVWRHGMPLKLFQYVKFPEILNMEPFLFNYKQTIEKMLARTSFASDKSSPKFLKKLNNYVVSSNLDLLTPLDTENASKALYQLTGVIVHIGDWGSHGHFVAYRRCSQITKNGLVHKWYLVSDTLVKQVPLNEVLASSAYMLFYEKV